MRPTGSPGLSPGGKGGRRVLHSRDWGSSWTVEETPVAHKTASSGLFSIAATATSWIAVGGDYRLETNGEGNITLRAKAVKAPPPTYLSAVIWRSAREAFAVGPRGTFRSLDAGESWTKASDEGFHTITIAPGGTIFAAGARGRIARWEE